MKYIASPQRPDSRLSGANFSLLPLSFSPSQTNTQMQMHYGLLPSLYNIPKIPSFLFSILLYQFV